MCQPLPLAPTVTVTVFVKIPVRSCWIAAAAGASNAAADGAKRKQFVHPPSQHRPCPSSSFSAIPQSRRGPIFARRYHRCIRRCHGSAHAGLYTERARSVRVDVVPRTSPASGYPSFSPPFQSIFPQAAGVSDEPLGSIISRLLLENREKVRPHLPICHRVHCVFNWYTPSCTWIERITP
jgi:hypothetical protein